MAIKESTKMYERKDYVNLIDISDEELELLFVDVFFMTKSGLSLHKIMESMLARVNFTDERILEMYKLIDSINGQVYSDEINGNENGYDRIR